MVDETVLGEISISLQGSCVDDAATIKKCLFENTFFLDQKKNNFNVRNTFIKVDLGLDSGILQTSYCFVSV